MYTDEQHCELADIYYKFQLQFSKTVWNTLMKDKVKLKIDLDVLCSCHYDIFNSDSVDKATLAYYLDNLKILDNFLGEE